MDNHSQNSNRDLPNTPRVSDKILQYYKNFGQERDLKKFMRLYSPVSSQDSPKTHGVDSISSLCTCCKRTNSGETISSTTSCEVLVMKALNDCHAGNSKSLPNIVQEQASGEECIVSKDFIYDINIETKGETEKIISISTDDLKTPKKTLKNTKTQTPESVAKTHRRLEWDSLGDVGYKKSMSTSNISTMERSLLREFFKENSVMSEPTTSLPIEEQNTIETVQKQKEIDVENSTPTLACSTFVAKMKSGAKPKMISQYTSSTSLYEKFEKYAQTSLIKVPTVRSQEIQCTMSSSNSAIESTATPSSFEYYSSKSSNSTSSKLSDNPAIINLQKKSQLHEHPFITSITDLLMKRKCLVEKNQITQYHNIHEVQTKFEAASNENKENQLNSAVDSATVASFSLSKQPTELDLGIQLICSLIDAKSINGRQKKQLIRDIIKRITCLEGENKIANSTINTIGDSTNNSSDCHQHVYDTNISNRFEQDSMLQLKGVSKLAAVSPLEKEKTKTNEYSSASTSHTSDNLRGISIFKQTKNYSNSKSINFPKQHENKNSCKPFPSKKKLKENSQKENRTEVLTVPAAAIIKDAQSEVIIMRESEEKNRETASKYTSTKEASTTKSLKTSTERKTNRCTQTSRTSLESTSITSTPDLTTQKVIVSPNNELSNSNTIAEQHTMSEWLNPLTQSEIDYEEKKQIEMRKKAAAQQQKLMKKSKYDCGRMHQLNWIENEINRLECLKHLILKDETTYKSSTSASSFDHSVHKSGTKNSNQTDKLYDTVYSDKSSVLRENAEQLVNEIEIILEESHENVNNFKDNIKCTKDRKRETQIMYAKEDDSIQKNKPNTKHKNKNINVHEEQLINKKSTGMNTKQEEQRGKMNTPSTNQSEESESLRVLVQERKREFMEAYKSKKQHHYEVLKQQKKDLNYLNIQKQTTTATDSELYSVPHTIRRKYSIPSTSSHKETKIKTYDNEILVDQQEMINTNNHKVISTISSNTNSTTINSSSSMFCISSDVSVPMGSHNTSTTPTTTHQYDDVATALKTAGAAVQTSESIMRSKPIYGPINSLPFTASTYTTTACIQVKPKGIAYIIEFPTSFNDIKKNDVLKKPKKKSCCSTTTDITSNLKPSTSSEPLLTLREHLEKNNPKFLQRCKERKVILNELHLMRQERYRQLREIIDNASLNSLDRHLQNLPPPPIQKTHILKTKEMKALTNKRFANLNEVVAKQEREIEEKKRRSNRILRDVFNKRLQKRVRSGKPSLNHSKTVI